MPTCLARNSAATCGESLRHVVALTVLVSPSWQVNFIGASGTAANTTSSGPSSDRAMADLSSFPVLMLRSGRPELEGGWHEEINVHHKISQQASVEVAAFHDQSRDTPVFGSGNAVNPDYLQDPFSSAFVYDAGSTESNGVRVAYRQKFGDNFDLSAVYAFAGALAPGSEDVAATSLLRDSLNMRYRHSVGGRLTGRMRHSRTEFHAGYKWISGPALTHQDSRRGAIRFGSLSERRRSSTFAGQPLELPLGVRGRGAKFVGARIRSNHNSGWLGRAGFQYAIVPRRVELPVLDE